MWECVKNGFRPRMATHPAHLLSEEGRALLVLSHFSGEPLPAYLVSRM